MSAPAYPVPTSAATAFGWTRAQAAFFALHLATWIAAALQLFIDTAYDNLICVVFVLCSSTLTFMYIRGTRALHEVPLSTVAVLGLCMTTQWGALVGQSALWGSLTENLRVPLQTFGYLAGFQLVAVAAHWVSRRFKGFMSARQVGAAVLAPLGIFHVPSVSAMWAMGFIGLGANVVGKVFELGLLGKIADGFAPFSWAPFVIPLLAARYGSAYCNARGQWFGVVAFAGVLMVMGLALNARAFMLAGVVTALLLFGVSILDDDRPVALRSLRFALLALVAGAALFQPLGYFFTAMQVARGERDKLSKLEMIKHTFAVLQDPVAIRRESNRVVTDADVGAYDEYYFSSSMVGRLVETKFHDNGFYMVQDIRPVESRLVAEDAVDRVVSVLPFPVLKAIGMERSKYATLYSAGDLLAHMRLGGEMGQFRTGSMFAQGLAIFGVWTPFLYFLLCLPIFIAWDILSRAGRGGAVAVTSVVGLLLVYRLFAYGIVTESISNVAGLLLRFHLQTILFYALVFGTTRLVWKPFDAAAAALRGKRVQAA